MNRICSILMMWLCGFACMTATDAGSYAPQSALAKGKWIRIQVQNTGMYKITDDELKKMGFADPLKVSVHGYGGWPLTEDFRKPYIDDLPAVATYRGSNYLLFYGRGTVKWEYSEQENSFVHTNNPYSLSGYYFLTDGAVPEEMEALPAAGTAAALTVSSFDEYRVFEEDRVSVNSSGREFFGESFVAGGSHTLTSPVLRIPGITAEDGQLLMRFIARPRSTAGTAILSIDGNPLVEVTIPAVGVNADTYTKAVARTHTGIWKGSKSETPAVSLSYSKTGDENVYLDYIRLHVKRELRQYGACTLFRSVASRRNVSRFVIRNADEHTVVFDVTDAIHPKRIETERNGTEVSFTVPAGDLREFAAVQTDRAQEEWSVAGEVKNQNLHALPQTEMIIIVQEPLRSQAERVAEWHRTKDGLSVEIVAPQQIYNEFSSGTPDATAIRRFMKMFYDRSTAEASRPRYLLLFGDGAFDNRAVTAGWKNVSMTNMLPTYQSENSLNQYSYVTDDYFGALEDAPFGAGAIQLGIGRFPVRTLEEATLAADKVLSYMDKAPAGAWKNRICFVADDGSADDSYSAEHMEYADDLAERLRAAHPEFLVSKIFFDAYRKTGSSYPDVRQNIRKQLNDGLLVINYTGHGNTEQWSDENVLSATADIARFSYPCLPLWITATCDFTRFDHTATSAGESVFLQKSGGIAMFTTTRVVYSSNNFQLNKLLLEELFSAGTQGSRHALGDVIRNTKSKLVDTNKFNFILIGDPAMKPARPEYSMTVTTINGRPASSEDPATFSALEKITVEGNILLPDGSRTASDFSGSLNVTILDSRQTLRTLDNNHTGNTFEFTDYPNTLHTGNSTVDSGHFTFTFTVPKDISYSNGPGLINLYAATGSADREAAGYFDGFKVGGSAENPADDTEGPEIRRLFLNDSTFADGGKVNTTPLFVARLYDKSGVNMSGSSIGHDITLSIDNRPALTYNLNAYYQLLPGAEGEGLVSFPLPALTPGTHTAEFKVWDVANNPTLRSFTFEAVEDLKPAIERIAATPVPAREHIQFLIYHNRPESVLQVHIAVYDMTGRLRWQRNETGSSALHAPYTLEWNLADTGGSRLRPGIYIYRAAIRTAQTAEVARSGKFVVLAQ